MRRFKSNNHFLHVLRFAKPKLRKAIIKTADNDYIKALCERCINVLNGNHKISRTLKKNLGKLSHSHRAVGDKKGSLKRKRDILFKNGGFLPMLLGSILSGVLGSLIR